MNTSKPGRDPVAPGPDSASASASELVSASTLASASPQPATVEPEGQAQSPDGQGARLRAAREAAGLSVEAVGARLRLSERQVAALEADDHAALPPGPFVRGFVRNYARLLGLDPQAFEAPEVGADPAIPVAAVPQVGLARPQYAIRLETGRTSANRRWLVAAGVALLLGAIGSWVRFEHFGEVGALFARHAEPQVAGLGSPVSAAPGATPGPASAAVPSAAPAATESDQSSPRAAPAATPVAPPPVPSIAAVPDLSAGAPGASPAAQTAAQPGRSASSASALPAAGSALPAKSLRPTDSVALAAAAKSATRKLQLEFDADSWVEVRDDTGKILLSGMSRAGDRRDVEAHGPVRIVVGNAPKTRLSFDGHPVDLAEFTRMTVARLTIDPTAENPATPPVMPAAEVH